MSGEWSVVSIESFTHLCQALFSDQSVETEASGAREQNNQKNNKKKSGQFAFTEKITVVGNEKCNAHGNYDWDSCQAGK